MSNDEHLNPDDIWIDERVLVEAGKIDPRWADEEARQAWMDQAWALLEWGRTYDEWPEGYPLVSDRPAERGPNGERYVLLGFEKRDSEA